MPQKEAFDIGRAISLLRKEVASLPQAALFDQGYTSLSEQVLVLSKYWLYDFHSYL